MTAKTVESLLTHHIDKCFISTSALLHRLQMFKCSDKCGEEQKCTESIELFLTAALASTLTAWSDQLKEKKYFKMVELSK